MNFSYFSQRLLSNLHFLFYPQLRKGLNLKGLNSDESLQILLETKKSLIRWGDGETVLAMGGNIPYQKNSPQLRSFLIEILKNANSSDYFFAVPWHFLNLPISNSKAKYWRHTRYIVFKYLPENTICLDAHLFRRDEKSGKNSLNYTEIEKLWTRFHNIIIISGHQHYLNAFTNEYKNHNCIQIKTPEKNAFEKLYYIESIIEEKLQHLQLSNTCILAACGPCAKILVAKFAKRLTCYDIGHYLNHKYSK